MRDDENPFRAPDARLGPRSAAADADDLDCWTDGRLLIMKKGAWLPDGCVRCGRPNEGFRLRRTLSWHPSLYYLVILLNILLYAIVALCVRHTAKVMFPLCPAHRKRRKQAIAIGWLGSIGGIAVLIGSAAAPDDGLMVALCLIGLAVLVSSLIYGLTVSQVVTAQKIDRTFAWIKGVSPDYLAELPTADGPR